LSSRAARAPFVGEGRGHADVHDDQVRVAGGDRGEQAAGVAQGGDHLTAGVPEEPGQALA
jgi:hypothetical protein